MIGKPVVIVELFRDARGDDCFAKTNHVGEEKATVLFEL